MGFFSRYFLHNLELKASPKQDTSQGEGVQSTQLTAKSYAQEHKRVDRNLNTARQF